MKQWGEGNNAIKVTKAVSTKAECVSVQLIPAHKLRNIKISYRPLSPRRPLISLALGEGVHRYEQPSSIIRRH